MLFQWASWYVWGYCEDRFDYRMFKLNRIPELKSTGEKFEPRPNPGPQICAERLYPFNIDVTALFEPGMKWRLVEDYGIESFTEQPDGKLLFQFGFMDKNSLFGWLLSFGDQVKLLTPEHLRSQYIELIEKMKRNYQE